MKIIGPKDLKNTGHLVINVTSGSHTWARKLSPQYLGPVKMYGNYTALNVENARQFCKVYPTHVDSNNNPTEEYFKWASKGWNKQWLSKPSSENKIKPLYSLWDNQKLDYIESRKKIYIPLYKEAVLKTSAFKTLQELYADHKIALFDLNGYDYESLEMSLEDVVNCKERKLSHAFILAMLLEQYSK